jgi:Predicted nucleoside-diphosphate-sugar epimerases
MRVNAKILVTGTKGTNGREIVRQLTARGIAVRALVRRQGRTPWDTPLVQEAEGDLGDPESLKRAMDGVEKVVAITPRDEDAVRWCENLATAAKCADVRQFVRFSARGADGQAGAVILRQHGEIDAMIAAAELAYTILRPNAFFQSLLASAPAIKAAGRIVASVGEARLSFVDVRDLAEAAVRVLTEPNHQQRIYTLTGPEALRYRDLARDLSGALARPVIYHPVAPEEFETELLAAGVPPWQASAVTELQAAFATGAFARPTDDLGELLARQPRRFSDFLRDYAGSFR